jgi:hypothetical protein
MRGMVRNKRSFWYALYQGVADVTDNSGYLTGEKTVTYTTPVEAEANISAATGMAFTDVFGTEADYDKVIVTFDMDCPIDEHSVLYVDVTPAQGVAPDYIVKRVSKSLNSISIAIAKVR